MGAITSYRRGGRFTSSQIYKLCKSGRGEFGFGAPALTYIEEKQIERRLESSLDLGGYSRPATWGIFMEQVVIRHLVNEDLGYKLSSRKTEIHPDLELGEYWSGSCDIEYFIGSEAIRIAETKSYQKKKFAQYSDCLIKGDLENFKKNFDEEYWQLVSNAILHDVDEVEAISFMPYESEHEYIKELVENYDLDEPWKYRFIAEEKPRNLPFLNDGNKHYKNLNRLIFKVPQEDIDFLSERVEKAIILLNRD